MENCFYDAQGKITCLKKELFVDYTDGFRGIPKDYQAPYSTDYYKTPVVLQEYDILNNSNSTVKRFMGLSTLDGYMYNP